MKSRLSSCVSVRAFVHFISLSIQLFPHVIHVKAWDGPILELMLNRVCVCCVNGGQVLRTIGLVGERLFFMAASCWEKDFLWLQGIVSFKYEFYCWKEASRDQRVGLIIPVFAVWASEGDHLSRVQSKEGLAEPRATQCPCYLGDRWHTHKHRKRHSHVEILALMHNQKHACCCTHMNCQAALVATRVICILILFTLQIQQNANVNTWLNLWQQHSLIS